MEADLRRVGNGKGEEKEVGGLVYREWGVWCVCEKGGEGNETSVQSSAWESYSCCLFGVVHLKGLTPASLLLRPFLLNVLNPGLQSILEHTILLLSVVSCSFSYRFCCMWLSVTSREALPLFSKTLSAVASAFTYVRCSSWAPEELLQVVSLLQQGFCDGAQS